MRSDELTHQKVLTVPLANEFVSSDVRVVLFHRSRRMFAVVNGVLRVAEAGLQLSHTEWFLRDRIISETDDEFFRNEFSDLMRGFVDETGVYFYRGASFSHDDVAHAIFLGILDELVKELRLPKDTAFFGGMVRQDTPGRWPSQKALGSISDILEGSKR